MISCFLFSIVTVNCTVAFFDAVNEGLIACYSLNEYNWFLSEVAKSSELCIASKLKNFIDEDRILYVIYSFMWVEPICSFSLNLTSTSFYFLKISSLQLSWLCVLQDTLLTKSTVTIYLICNSALLTFFLWLHFYTLDIS